MAALSPSLAPPAAAAGGGGGGTGAWGPYDSKTAFVSNVVATAVGVGCAVLVAFLVFIGLRRCRARRSKAATPPPPHA